MITAIRALNAKIRSNPVSDFICSTHFWGPVSNFGIPIAAVADMKKDPAIISGPMTVALIGYSSIMMRYAFAIRPQNYLIFGMHVVNFTAQTGQLYRWVRWRYVDGGRVQEEASAAVKGKPVEFAKIE